MKSTKPRSKGDKDVRQEILIPIFPQGHDVGDLLLIEVAQRISRCVREMDTIARFGGDEFVVMLGELDMDQAKATVQKTGYFPSVIRRQDRSLKDFKIECSGCTS